jgi:D-alanyl-D-alanine carboxypeptidase
MDDPDYAIRIAGLHRALGIGPGYAAMRALNLQSEFDESILVPIATLADGRVIRLGAAAAGAWLRLRVAAANDGVVLLPFSGFRSVVRQAEIIRAQLGAGRSLADILSFIAAPGYSEHHTGRALDLGTPGEPPLNASFSRTAAFAWLVQHAGTFGFQLSYPVENPHAIAYEPWHWCWHHPTGPVVPL